MSATECFTDALIELSVEEILSRGGDVTPTNQLEILKIWIDDLDETVPRNRAERKYLDCLERAIDRISLHMNHPVTV